MARSKTLARANLRAIARNTTMTRATGRVMARTKSKATAMVTAASLVVALAQPTDRVMA